MAGCRRFDRLARRIRHSAGTLEAGVPHVATIDKALTATKLLEPVVVPLANVARVEV
jgi:hypothetical protein